MKASRTSSLGYALLGLLQQQPASGYELRKVFSAAAMKTYSDSPGAIYPALERLEQQGLIHGSVEKGAGLRRRRIFRLTPSGLAELRKWVARPVTPEELVRNQEEIFLRFAFSEGVAGPASARVVLQSLQAALKTHLPALREEFERVQATASVSGRLAFAYGIRSYECLLKWTHQAIAAYEKKGKRGAP